MLSFTSFPTTGAPAAVQPMFRMNDKRSLAAVPAVDPQDGTRFTDLFAGGALLLEYGLAAQRNPTIPPTLLADFADGLGGDASRIVASIDPATGQRDVFTLSPPDGRLFRLRGVPTTDGPDRGHLEWLPPVLIARQAASCTTWRRAANTPGAGSTLYLAIGYHDGSLEVLFQDAVSGLWQRETVVLGGARTYTEITTFSSRVVVTDEENVPQPAVALHLTPEYPCSAFVDGRLTHFNTLVPIVVRTGADGSVTIVQSTRSIGSPSLRVRLEDGTEHDFRPDATVLSRTDALRVPQDIQQARRSSGGLLFPEGKDEPSCLNALAGLAELRKTHDELSGGQASWGRPGPRGARSDAPVLSTTVTFGPAGPVVDTLAADQLGAQDWLLAEAGDLFRWLWGQAGAAVTWGVNLLPDGTRAFFAKVGDTLWSFVITVASQLLEATDWVLQNTLGITLEDLVDWLGFVFDWTDIRDNHDAIRNTLTATLEHVLGTAGSVKAQIRARAERAKELLAQGSPVPGTDAARELVAASSRSQSATAPSPQHDRTGAHTAQAQWGNSKISSYDGFAEVGEIVIGRIPGELAHLAADELAILLAAIKECQDKVLPRLTELPFGVIPEMTLEIVGDAVIDAVEKAAETVVDVGLLCVAAARVLLETRIEIPVLTAFYEQTLAPGSTFSLLDLGCLAAATFSTVVFKTATGLNLYSTEQLALLTAPGRSFDDVMTAYSLPRPVRREPVTGDVGDVIGGAVIVSIAAGNRFPLTYYWTMQNVGQAPWESAAPMSICFELINYLLGLAYWILKITKSPSANKDWFYYASYLPVLAFFVRARQIYSWIEMLNGHIPPRGNDPLRILESTAGILMIVFQVNATIKQANDPPPGSDTDPSLLTAWKVDLAFAAISNLAAGLQYGATAAQIFVSPDTWEEIQLARMGAQGLQLLSVLVRAVEQWELGSSGIRAQFSGLI